MHESVRRPTARPAPDFSALSPATLASAWILLVAVGVAGRLWQPAYNVTPLMAVALCAGAIFPHPMIAASVPAAALAIGNLTLPGGGAYGSWVMAIVVYAAFMWPVLAGPLLRRHRVPAALGGALAGSLVFYVTTNFAHWFLGSDYPHTVRGLTECYVAALPFYRWMPVGDLVWTAALFGTVSGLSRVSLGRESGEACR